MKLRLLSLACTACYTLAACAVVLTGFSHYCLALAGMSGLAPLAAVFGAVLTCSAAHIAMVAEEAMWRIENEAIIARLLK